MTSAVLHAPLKWLDTVPVGRILNRFIADFNVIDSKLATDLASLIHYGLRVGGITIAGALVSPWLILCVIPLIATCIAYARMYLAGARDVKRLGMFLINTGAKMLYDFYPCLSSVGMQTGLTMFL